MFASTKVHVSGTGPVGGASLDPVTPPAAASESVAAGASLSAVTFGAFTDTGARIASYSASKTNVVGSATISGTGLGPYTISGAADSEVLLIELDALDSGGNVLATAAYTGSIGSPTTGGAWVTLVDYDLTDLTTTSALPTGTSTLSFESISDTIDVVKTLINGTASTVTAINGQGIVFDGGTNTGHSVTLSFRPSDWLASYTANDVQRYVYAITFVLTTDLTAVPGSSGFFAGVNIGSNTSQNSGDARCIDFRSLSNGTDEKVSIRLNTSSTTAVASRALRTDRTVTCIVHFGELVQIQETASLTVPTPDLTQSANVYVAGGDAVGRDDTTRVYQASSGIRAFLTAIQTGDGTCSRIIVRRLE